MRKLTVIILLFLFAGLSVSAQTSTNIVAGTISDTISKQNLYKAVISILSAKDSMLVKFARTDLKGHFEIKDLPPGKYVLLTTFPNYADYTDTLTLAANTVADLGRISMITRAHLLQEVIVKQTISAIRMKGDTLEYKADSFHVDANASVEELLKKMPGMQVDKNGQITAQGKKIQKVLVDGEEFFGDDPTLVTQNIRANMVDKVQVYDKRSDQAEFTGVDDGERTTTLNLKLKDDKKKGYFGKLDGTVGTNGFYNAQAMFNKFRKKEKISVYGIFSNTGKTGLNWQDQRTYGDNSSDIQFDEDGEGFFENNGDELEGWGGRYNGQGYPKVQTGGAHYNNKWGDEVIKSINGNYKIMNLEVTGINATTTQYILPDTMYFSSQRQVFNNNILRNKGNAVYEIDFDSTSSLKILMDAGVDNKKTRSQYFTESRGEDSLLVNDGSRTINSAATAQIFNSSFLWKKKFKKKGRTFSLAGKQNYSNTGATGFLYANNNFYKGGAPVGGQITDQYKTSENKLLAFNVKATYTEPLSQAAALLFNYGLILNNSSNNRASFNKSSGGKYDVLDTTYSNNYAFNYLTQSAGAVFTLIKKKYRFGLGNSVGYTDFSQTDQRNGITGKRDFVNWFPQANFTYTFNSHSRTWMNYNGSTTQPSLQQIQPLRTNDDPLNIVLGNPSLQPSFRNRLAIFYNDFQALSGRNIYFNASYSNTNNAFATNDYVDSLGRKFSQSINVDGNYNLHAYLSYGFKLFDANIDIGSDISNTRNVNIVNSRQNITNSNTYNLHLYAGKEVEKLYNNSISFDATYTTSRSSIQKNVKVNYWTYEINPDFDFYLPWKLQLHADCNFIFRQKTSAFDDNNNVVLLNAWFGKKMLPGDALVIKISGNDILNQNIGFNRNVSTNYVVQNTYLTIQRYFTLSAVWNFTKGQGKAKPAPVADVNED
jgi:hypothetical protein